MKFKVVIVDDNRPTADMVHKIIDWESLGCSVVSTSYDSYAGKAAILEHKPDLVIADINMPGMDGLKMVELVQQFIPHAKIIFISAHSTFSYASRALKLHAFDYVLKPFTKYSLLEPVKKAVEELKGRLDEELDGGEDSGSAQSGGSLLVKKMLLYMESHISSQLSLTELSEQFLLNPSYISTLIRRQTGKSYSEYVADMRIKIAKELLLDPRNHIDEISSAVGYKNYVTFYRVFVRAVGVSPSEYREQKMVK